MTPQAAINSIDAAINDLRRAAPSLADRHERECELFRQRGIAQLARAEAAERAARKWSAPSRLRMCPTCRHHTLPR